VLKAVKSRLPSHGSVAFAHVLQVIHELKNTRVVHLDLIDVRGDEGEARSAKEVRDVANVCRSLYERNQSSRRND
jgi:hypothetical protein